MGKVVVTIDFPARNMKLYLLPVKKWEYLSLENCETSNTCENIEMFLSTTFATMSENFGIFSLQQISYKVTRRILFVILSNVDFFTK